MGHILVLRIWTEGYVPSSTRFLYFGTGGVLFDDFFLSVCIP